MKRIIPSFELLKVCSDMLSEFYDFSYIQTKIEQGHGDFTNDHRSQLIGYLEEIIDDYLFKRYSYKTTLYEIGEESGYFAKCNAIEVKDNFLIAEGTVDISDTDCKVLKAIFSIHELLPRFSKPWIKINATHLTDDEWKLHLRIDIKSISEYKHEKLF